MSLNKTAIEWTHVPGTTGATWNPVTGCTKVSPGCGNCYAEALTRRFGRDGGDFAKIVHHEDRLEDPVRTPAPHTIFVCSMSDLFHPAIAPAFFERIWDVMRRTPQHTYLVLTKRPRRMAHFADRHGWLENAWAGVSVESAKYLTRIDVLSRIPAPVRFVSAEPLLAPFRLGARVEWIDWLITGGESGPRARRFEPDWAMSLIAEGIAANIAVFHKQNGGRSGHGGDELLGQRYKEFPIERRYRVPSHLGTKGDGE